MTAARLNCACHSPDYKILLHVVRKLKEEKVIFVLSHNFSVSAHISMSPAGGAIHSSRQGFLCRESVSKTAEPPQEL